MANHSYHYYTHTHIYLYKHHNPSNGFHIPNNRVLDNICIHNNLDSNFHAYILLLYPKIYSLFYFYYSFSIISSLLLKAYPLLLLKILLIVQYQKGYICIIHALPLLFNIKAVDTILLISTLIFEASIITSNINSPLLFFIGS